MAAVIALAMGTAACRPPDPALPAHRHVVGTSPTLPESTTGTAPTTTGPVTVPAIAHLGGTLGLQATSLTGSTTSLSLTLDQVVDPVPPTLDAAESGDRFVQLRFAVKNDGPASFTDAQQPYYPPLAVAVDNTGYTDVSGAQPLPYGGYSPAANDAPGSPGSCAPTLTIPAQTVATDCFVFELPVGVPVVIASVALDLGDSPDGSLGEWLMPSATTAGPTITSDHSPGIAHQGGTLTLRPAGPTTTGPGSAVLDVTLDQVIDPARAPALAPSPASSDDRLTGDRVVALQLTLSNVGNVTVPCAEGQEDELSLGWLVDPDGAGDGGSYSAGLPDPFCPDGFSSPGLAPGATRTGEISFELPSGVPVVRVTAGMSIAGFGSGPGADWQIP
jgi:hypothetical protein